MGGLIDSDALAAAVGELGGDSATQPRRSLKGSQRCGLVSERVGNSGDTGLLYHLTSGDECGTTQTSFGTLKDAVDGGAIRTGPRTTDQFVPDWVEQRLRCSNSVDPRCRTCGQQASPKEVLLCSEFRGRLEGTQTHRPFIYLGADQPRRGGSTDFLGGHHTNPRDTNDHHQSRGDHHLPVAPAPAPPRHHIRVAGAM